MNENMPNQILDHLEGSWFGEGRGSFPTIDTFDYRETLTFERRSETTLYYEQRTEKRPLNQPAFQTSHSETGFLRVLATGELELTNNQSGGRSELLIGGIEMDGRRFRLHFKSQTLTNDERMIASARTFEIEGDTLTYEMTMHTTSVDQLTPHLKATLHRVCQ